MSAISSDLKSSGPDAAQREHDRRRGRFVPWIIAAFYLTFMTTLIGFVVIAYRNPPSEVTPEAYEKGLAYNDTLNKGLQQNALGWTSDIRLEHDRLTFRLDDAHHAGVEGAVVRAWFVHPGNASLDRSFDLHPIAPGVYAADAALPARGLWTVHVTAEQKGRQYQAVTPLETQ
ncbi:MAG: FixH family protein [Asticcacaulis sp.]